MDEEVANKKKKSTVLTLKPFATGWSKEKNSLRKVLISNKDDFLKYDEDNLRRSGVLIQRRSYKKTKNLPLKNGQSLTVKGGNVVTFFKKGHVIGLATEKGDIFDPLVDPEHVRGIFKDYSENEVLESDVTSCLQVSEKTCPLCHKKFGEKADEELMIHAASCNGQEIVKSPPRKIIRIEEKESSITSSKSKLKNKEKSEHDPAADQIKKCKKFKFVAGASGGASSNSKQDNSKSIETFEEDTSKIKSKKKEKSQLDSADQMKIYQSDQMKKFKKFKFSGNASGGASSNSNEGNSKSFETLEDDTNGTQICPICDENFGMDAERLIEHAATCNGFFEEELTQENCPICQKEYPPEQLPVHAQECAQQMFD